MKLFVAFLKSNRSTRAHYVAEHHSYYVDQEHLNFVDDLFDLFDLSPDEEEALLVLLKEEQMGCTDGVPLASSFEATAMPINRPCSSLHQLTTAVNSLARGKTYRLRFDLGPYLAHLASLAK